MSRSSSRPARARKKRRRARRRRPTRRRKILTLGVVLVVALATAALFLNVAVRQRFDGRLWSIPARVYSGPMEVYVGDRVTIDSVIGRLERSGYARIERRPELPGQFRRAKRSLDVYVRELSTPAGKRDERLLSFRFERDRLASIADRRGRSVRRAVLEPELLATLFGSRLEDREPTALDTMPDVLVHAVLAAEDARFFEHWGFDPRGIARAALANAREGRVVQGGSTITQQTVKNLYLGQERTWWRKIRELVMAPMLDASYSKERILEAYLNDVYLGQRGPVAICGVQSAARFYFGHDLSHLTLAEAAALAGMIRSPGRYNPFDHADRVVERRLQVLEAMARLGSIGEEEVAAAGAEPLRLASGRAGFKSAPYAADFIRAELAERFPGDVLRRDGLSVYTTIDTGFQQSAEAALREGLERLERGAPQLARKGKGRLQGAVVVTEPATGAILALVGGRDYADSQFNRATQARRQPGSCFKPFVYAAGFERARSGAPGGLTPATLLEDRPFEMQSGGELWRPANYDRHYRGPVTARQALEESLNVPTVRASQQIGVDAVAEAARACGIRSPLAVVPSLALGSSEVTPLELAESYGTFARLGVHIKPWIVRWVTDAEGTILEGATPAPSRVMAEDSAFLVNEVLRGVFERGTAAAAADLGYRGTAAGKTGTTDDKRDAWFVGYTPELLGLVWVGFDDNSPTGLSGAAGALPIWVDLMTRSAAGELDGEFGMPPGVVTEWIDPESGALAGRSCPEAREEFFIRGTEPQGECPIHKGSFRRWLERWKEPEGPA
ncbi:MAG: PBP1A family penicillin-binding protein [bacterium]|nr:PBP1A family penicillin-binding protein [bacterium]